MKIGRVIHLESRLHGQHLGVGQRNRILMGHVPGDEQIAAPVEYDVQLAAHGGHVLAAEGVVRVIQIPDEAVAHASQDGGAAHNPVANDRTAQPCFGAKRPEVPGDESCGRVEGVRGWLRDEIDGAAHGVPAIERALRAAQHFDALEIQKITQHHDRPGQVDAVDVHRRARIRAGKHHIGADATDRQLREVRVLGERHRGCVPCDVRDVVRFRPLEVRPLEDAHGYRGRLHVALAGLRRGHDRLLLRRHRERQRHDRALAWREANGSPGRGKP